MSKKKPASQRLVRDYRTANGLPTTELKTDNAHTLRVGQLWEVGGKLYRIDSMSGPDVCYPIEMREVARDPKINREIDARAEHYPPISKEALLATKDPMEMKQEPAWFERDDVSLWSGSAAAWKRNFS